MQKLVTILLMMAFATTLTAQIPKIPNKLKIPKREIVNRTTGHRGYENVKIDVELTKTEGKGETLKFSSNVNIDKVEISFVDVPHSKQEAHYNEGTKTGVFYLESGAYKSGQTKGYMMNFYVKGFDKPVWVCLLTERKLNFQ